MLIMLVDDDPEDRLIFEETVSSINPDHKCISFRDGQEALNYLKNDAVILPDVIFLDINMPILDGRNTLSQLKTSRNYKGIPVCVYTTESRPAERQNILNLGADWFITKPASMAALENCVANVIKEVSVKS